MSGLIGTPAFFARRAPPSPPACSAKVVSSSVVPLVRCAQCASAPSKRSAKILRGQVGTSQNHRRCGRADGPSARATADRAGAAGSGYAAVGSVHPTAGTEPVCVLVRQPGPDSRRCRRRSGRCTSVPVLPQATRPSILTLDGHAIRFVDIPEDLTSDARRIPVAGVTRIGRPHRPVGSPN